MQIKFFMARIRLSRKLFLRMCILIVVLTGAIFVFIVLHIFGEYPATL